jgi:hypothetical protein
MTGGAASCTTDQTLLGQGIRRDARRNELLWVGIMMLRTLRRLMTPGSAVRTAVGRTLAGR